MPRLPFARAAKVAALLALFSSGPLSASARPPPKDAHPPYAFVPVVAPLAPAPRRPLAGPRKPGVEQLGEVIILEGDGDIVTEDGSGGAGILLTARRQDPPSITRRLYTVYGDDFDQVIVFTSFEDNGSPGALAWARLVQQTTDGIGAPPDLPARFDESVAWGSADHHLESFVNMKYVEDYPEYDGLHIDDPRSIFYPVLAQEFGHRWLAYAKYKDRDGAISDRLLGRDGVHWSPAMQASGSVLDGNELIEQQDGSFACVARAVRYAPLDLYLMGLLGPREVPPFFVVNDAVTDAGRRIDPRQDWQRCERLRGRREDIAISQLVDAMGPRRPAAPEARKDFRVAFVLVTRPGERAGDVLPAAAKLDRARRIWEAKFVEYSGGRATMCTQVSVPCGGATARIAAGSIVEAGGDGVIAPGEPIEVRYRLVNDGPVSARDVTVTVESALAAFTPASATVAEITPGSAVEVVLRGRYTGGGGRCNQRLAVHATARVGKAEFRGFAEAEAGAVTLVRGAFDEDAAGWATNLDGQDTALTFAFAWGAPRRYDLAAEVQLQPDGGAGGGGACFFTGLPRGNTASGLHTGVEKGRSTLWSPPYDLRSASRPHVRWRGWFMALDQSDPRRLITSNSAYLWLDVANSRQSGRWFKVDEIAGADDRWRPRDIDLFAPENGAVKRCMRDDEFDCLSLARPVYFRFTVVRQGDADLVEAGVDDFTLVADAPGCHSAPEPPPPPPPTFAPSGLTCNAGAHAPLPVEILAALAIPLALRSRRRRRRDGAPYSSG